tara:strand:+ start:3940 stop:6366 length:2427 start_codon:yes stop_codon:yes gene_type:complete
MAEGETPSAAELAAAIEKLDTVIAKQKEILKLRQQDAKILGDINEQTRISAELKEADLTLLSQKLDKAKDAAAIEKALTFELEAQIKYQELKLDIEYTIEEKREVALKFIAKQRAQQELIKDATRDTEKFVGGIAGKLGIATKVGDTAVGKFMLMTDNLKQSGMGAKILSDTLSMTLDPLNLATALLSTMAESVVAVALALDVANSKFQRTTGFAGDFKGVMTDISQAGLLSGVSIEDAGAAMGSLANNFSAFNPTATETNARLAETAALLTKTGVSADISTGTMDFFNKAMGNSARVSADLTRELALAGTGIGISTNKMLGDFQKLSGYLIGFGDNATSVFKNLQAQAKVTGIAVESLVNIAKKFDAFDTAAGSVGSLNAVLGTNLSTIDMMNASSDQRLSMMAQEIQMATGGFKNLDRYTQMAVAQSIGAKDAAEAERLLSIARNPAELAKYNAEMQEQKATQEELKDLTASFVPIMEQFKIAVMGLGLALEPVIWGLGKIFEGVGFLIGKFFELNELMGGYLIPALGILSASFVAMAVAANMGVILSGLAAGIKLVGVAANFSSLRMIAFTAGFMALYYLLSMKINPVFVAAFHFMAVGIRILGMAFAAVPTKALAVMLVFSLLAATVALLVYGITDLLSLFITNVGILPELAYGLLLAGGAFYIFGAGVFAGATALAFAVPLLVLAAPLIAMMTISAIAMGFAFQSMGDGILNMGTGLQQVSKALSSISSLKDDDEFFAIQTDGGKTSMISAKGGVISNFSSENITVDVKIPEIKIPPTIVHVYVDSKEISKIVRTSIANQNGG